MSNRRGQQNTDFGEYHETFVAWCARKNLEKRGVILAGWTVFTELSPEEREKIFHELEDRLNCIRESVQGNEVSP